MTQEMRLGYWEYHLVQKDHLYKPVSKGVYETYNSEH